MNLVYLLHVSATDVAIYMGGGVKQAGCIEILQQCVKADTEAKWICGQIVLCYLQLGYWTRMQVVCYLEEQSLRFFSHLYRHSALQLLV